MLGLFYTDKDGVTYCKKVKPRSNLKTLSHNIVTQLSGEKGIAKNSKTPKELWSNIIDENIVSKVVVSDSRILFSCLSRGARRGIFFLHFLFCDLATLRHIQLSSPRLFRLDLMIKHVVVLRQDSI